MAKKATAKSTKRSAAIPPPTFADWEDQRRETLTYDVRNRIMDAQREDSMPDAEIITCVELALREAGIDAIIRIDGRRR